MAATSAVLFGRERIADEQKAQRRGEGLPCWPGVNYELTGQPTKGKESALQRRSAVRRLSQVACTQRDTDSQGSATCSVWAAHRLPTRRSRDRGGQWMGPQGGERVRLTTGQPNGSHDAARAPRSSRTCARAWCSNKSPLQAGLELLVAGRSAHAARGMDLVEPKRGGQN